MNLRSLLVVSGMSAILFGACKLNMNLNENYSDTKCAGYLGCSAGTSFGISTAAASDAGASTGVVVNSGCGMAPPEGPATVPGTPTGYKQFTVQGTGLTLAGTIAAKKGPRTFWVRVPADYDPTKHYRLVYLGQGCGGYNSANTATWQLFSQAQGGDEEAIYVAIDLPTDMANMDCYDNEDGPASQEWEAFQLFHYFVDSHYCVDEDKIYIAGYSTGGWLANMWGCYFAGDGEHPWNGVVPTSTTSALSAGTSRSESIDASSSMSDGAAAMDGAVAEAGAPMSTPGGTDAGADVKPFVPTPGARMFAPQFHIRAQASVSGGEPPNNPPCNGSVAGMWIHDAGDNSNPISGSQKALARVLKMNSCENSRTMPWHPEVAVFNSVCLQYIDCPTAYPVVFCKTNGEGHGSQPQRAIPGFKLFFDQVESGMTP